jgi:hypothetical protein
MNIAALIANIVQLVIILAIFFIKGLELGALSIFLLFLLMPIPFINVLALFFVKRPLLAADEGDGMVKREALRVNYSQEHCPTLTTGGTVYTVRDLSEGGVRIKATSATPFRKKVRGEIELVSGDRLRFKATLLRRGEGEAVFHFSEPVGTAILVKEKKALAAALAG